MNDSFLNKKSFIKILWPENLKGLISRTALHPYKGENSYRVYYYLPNGDATYYYSVPPLKNKAQRDIFLREFTSYLQDGLIPKKAAQKLLQNNFDDKNGDFDVFLNKYFNEYAVSKREKSNRSKYQLRCTIKSILDYFKMLGMTSICSITDDDINTWDASLATTMTNRNKPVAPATRNTRRKQLRAFLTVAKERGYQLQCNPEKMNIFEIFKGNIDHACNARKVIYPKDLIEAVSKCSFQSKHTDPDMRMIIKLWRYLGLRPGEASTLSEQNLHWENGRITEIRIMEHYYPGDENPFFVPKNEISHRRIPIPKEASDFLESLVDKLKHEKRYGKSENKLKEFPFLFVFWSKKYKCYMMDESKFFALFRKLTDHAIEEFNLSYKKDFYILKDLRRACNFFLKTELLLSDDHASAFLGHSRQTNNLHYQLDENKLKINDAKMRAGIENAKRLNAEIGNLYA